MKERQRVRADTLIVAGIYPDWAVMKDILGDKADDDSEVEKYLMDFD